MEATNRRRKSVGNGEGSLYYSETLKKWFFQYHYNGQRKTIQQRKTEKISDFKKRVTEIKFMLNNGTYFEKDKDTFIKILQRISYLTSGRRGTFNRGWTGADRTNRKGWKCIAWLLDKRRYKGWT